MEGRANLPCWAIESEHGQFIVGPQKDHLAAARRRGEDSGCVKLYSGLQPVAAASPSFWSVRVELAGRRFRTSLSASKLAGLTRCESKPAALERCTSSRWPQPLNATS